MFEKLKKNLQDRIEENAIKIPNAKYKDKNGKEHKEDLIIKRSKMPIFGDWKRIYPPIDEYGNINWINFIVGGKKNLFRLLAILIILGIVFFAFYNLFTQFESLKEACEPFLDALK